MVVVVLAAGVLGGVSRWFRRKLFTEILGQAWLLISERGARAQRIRAQYEALSEALHTEAIRGGRGDYTYQRDLTLAKVQHAVSQLSLECPDLEAQLEVIAAAVGVGGQIDSARARTLLGPIQAGIRRYVS